MRTARGTIRRMSAAWPLVVVPLTVLGVFYAGVPAAGLETTPAPTATPAITASPAPTDTPAPSAVDTPAPAPAPTTVATPAPPAAVGTPDPTPTPTPTPVVAPQPLVLPAPVVVTTFTTTGLSLAPIPAAGADASYLADGTPLSGAAPFQVFRVNVQVANPGIVARAWTPRVEYRLVGDAAFTPVPTAPTPGSPLHTTREWVAVAGGTEAGPATTQLASTHHPVPTGLASAPGRRTSGPNPDAAQQVPALTAVEQEFTLALSIDAAFDATYEVRVTDAGVAFDATTPGRVTVTSRPLLVLSPGQQQGATLAAPASDTLATAGRTALAAVVAPATTASNWTLPAPGQTVTVGPVGESSVHQPFGSTRSAECATCHNTHTAKSSALVKAESQTTQCLVCHGAAGLGGPTDPGAGATTPNDATTRSYYSHDTAVPGHTLASESADLAGGLNRHSQCTDCHNPHNIKAVRASYDATTATWTPSGATATSGVRLTFGAAGTTPTTTFLDGTVNPVTSEQQVCYKCHTAFTQQLANDPGRPSRDRTDVGREFNPANASFHPVEAPGRNQSTKLAESLAGSSPSKLWDLRTTDTIRCVMCHTAGTTAPGTPADAALPSHASANRGILVAPYESRLLVAAGTAYSPANSSLCLTCHAEAPFANPSGDGARTATNFVYHGLHMADIADEGSGGRDIDLLGAGQGNALCAECHFRSHSTTDAVPGQSLGGTGLVNFAPNVGPSSDLGGPVAFTSTQTGGTCTLTCHGKDHAGLTYARPTG